MLRPATATPAPPDPGHSRLVGRFSTVGATGVRTARGL